MATKGHAEFDDEKFVDDDGAVDEEASNEPAEQDDDVEDRAESEPTEEDESSEDDESGDVDDSAEATVEADDSQADTETDEERWGRLAAGFQKAGITPDQLANHWNSQFEADGTPKKAKAEQTARVEPASADDMGGILEHLNIDPDEPLTAADSVRIMSERDRRFNERQESNMINRLLQENGITSEMQRLSVTSTYEVLRKLPANKNFAAEDIIKHVLDGLGLNNAGRSMAPAKKTGSMAKARRVVRQSTASPAGGTRRANADVVPPEGLYVGSEEFDRYRDKALESGQPLFG